VPLPVEPAPATQTEAEAVAPTAESAAAMPQLQEPVPCQEPQLPAAHVPGGAAHRTPLPQAPDAAATAAAAAATPAATMRRSLIGYQGPLHQHQTQRNEEEQARWAKVSGTVQGLLRLLEEQEARVAQLEAANAAAAERIAHHEASVERHQQEQQASVAALSDSVKSLLQQGRALLRQGSTPSPERSTGGRPGSAAASDAGGSVGLDPSIEEFMEATSGCLQLHERRIDDLQVGPRVTKGPGTAGRWLKGAAAAGFLHAAG
jgi:hypothetical protein